MKDSVTNNELLQFMKGQFEQGEKRVDKIDTRLDGIDARLIGVNNRVDEIAVLFTKDFFDRFYRLEKQVADLVAAK